MCRPNTRKFKSLNLKGNQNCIVLHCLTITTKYFFSFMMLVQKLCMKKICLVSLILLLLKEKVNFNNAAGGCKTVSTLQ